MQNACTLNGCQLIHMFFTDNFRWHLVFSVSQCVSNEVVLWCQTVNAALIVRTAG